MRADEYLACDGLDLARLIAERQVSQREVSQCAREMLARANEALNFLAGSVGARAGQSASQGRFRGVPFLLKDLGPYLANVKQECGSRLTIGLSSDHDSVLAGRYRSAGLNVLGRTTTPELGIRPTTESILCGATRNPWNPKHIVGGSSGGSAAAVACGAVPIAHGSDAAGSLRIPAHCCGVFGLKPSRGRIPTGPGWGTLGDMAVSHVLTRTVRDSAAVLDETCMSELGISGSLAAPETPFAVSVERDPRPLRVAICVEPVAGTALAPICAESVRQAGQLAENLGHHVEEISIGLNWDYLHPALLTVIAAATAAAIDLVCERLKRTASDDTLEPQTLACWEYGRRISARDVIRAFDVFNFQTRRMAALLERFDIVILPVCSEPAPPLGSLWSASECLSVEAEFGRSMAFVQYTPVANVTGQPAMSIPWTRDPAGLPVGVQCIGGWGRDDVLLAFAGQIERARAWPRLAPLLVPGLGR